MTSTQNDPPIIGLLTVSDRAYRGEYEDLGGPAMRAWLENVLLSPSPTYIVVVVPDELIAVRSALVEMVDELGCSLVLTTGGTGPAPRDLTPEATEAVCQKMMPGFAEEMRRASLKVVPTAILSRQVAGIRGSSLIVNLPGKPSAIADCLNAVFAAVPYCLDLIGGAYLDTDPEKFESFRPGRKQQPLPDSDA